MGEFALARDLSPENRIAAARLVEIATPEFYALLPLEPQKLWNALVALFRLEGSDLFECRAYSKSGRVIGILGATYGVHNQASLLVSTIRLLQLLDPVQRSQFRQGIEIFRAGAPDIPKGALYLTRLSVASGSRRRGIGTVLLDHFREMAAPSEKLCLHVNSDNEPAIAFYRHHGFSVVSDPAADYLLMEAPARGGTA